MAALLSLLFAVVATALFGLLPGFIVARCVWPELPARRGDGRALLLALAWGAGVVPTLAFHAHLATGVRVTWPLLAAVAALHYAVAVAVTVRRGGRGALQWWLAPLRSVGPGTWLGVGAVWLLWLLRYDSAPLPPESSCIYGAALVATGVRGEDASLLFENIEDARLGNSGVIAGFAALYGELGFRWLYATCGALMALGGRELGRIARPGAAWAGPVGAAALALNPWVLSLPQADENVLALAFCAPTLALLLGKRPPWLLVGGLLGLVLSMRHVLILSAPAALLWAVWAPDRRRAALRLGLGVTLGTAFEHLHHLLALGSVLRFESNEQFPALPYSLLGVPFLWEGMVNWPLHDTLVRTPWNPSPMLIAWPLHGLRAWGTLAFLLLGVGAARGAWIDRRGAWFWAVWALPTAGILALQESWDFPNKMGVALVLFAALPWCAAHGLSALRDRRVLAGWLVAALALAWLPVPPIVGVADARYHARFPLAPEESPALVAAAAEDRGFGALPSGAALHRHGDLFAADHLRHLASVLRDRRIRDAVHPWGWGPGEEPPPGVPVTVAIRSDGPGGAPTFSLTDAPPDLDLVADGAGATGDLRVPWDAREVRAYALRGPRVSAVTLNLPYPGEPAAPCACTRGDDEFLGPCEDRCSVLFDVAGVAPRGHDLSGVAPWPAPGALGAPPWPPARATGGDVLTVRMPAGGLSFGIVELPYAQRLRLWRVLVTPEGVTVLDGPRWPWHG